jgi:hypothetical protein
MIRRFATAGLLVLTSAAVPLVASTPASAACGDNANAQFVHNGIRGFSSWNDICADRIRVTGDYSGLAPQGYYYVSLNFNANCRHARRPRRALGQEPRLAAGSAAGQRRKQA